jgi:hypothetical protein
MKPMEIKCGNLFRYKKKQEYKSKTNYNGKAKND